jgi:hypothetical protein
VDPSFCALWALITIASGSTAVAVLVAFMAGAASAVLYGLYESQKATAESQKAAARERETQASRDVQEQYIRGQQAEAGGHFDQAQERYF